MRHLPEQANVDGAIYPELFSSISTTRTETLSFVEADWLVESVQTKKVTLKLQRIRMRRD